MAGHKLDSTMIDAIKNSSIVQLINNYIDRTRAKNSDEHQTVSRMSMPENREADVEINKPIYATGDTIRNGNNEYMLPEYIDSKSVKVSGRNRGDYKPIESDAAFVTLLNELKPYEEASTKHEQFIGYDKDGNMKVGPRSNFGPGDMMSGTYMNRVSGVQRDESGNVQYKPSEKNKGRYQPKFYYDGDDNWAKEGSLNMLTERDGSTNTYGSVTGGRVLVDAGGNLITVSGSIDDIANQIDAIKKKYGVSYVDAYTLDNGTFNSGLRTYDGKFDAETLRRYDLRNSGGGNFIYIKNNDGKKIDSTDVSKPGIIQNIKTYPEPLVNVDPNPEIKLSEVRPNEDKAEFNKWFGQQVRNGLVGTTQDYNGRKIQITYGSKEADDKARAKYGDARHVDAAAYQLKLEKAQKEREINKPLAVTKPSTSQAAKPDLAISPGRVSDGFIPKARKGNSYK